jgi:excisionase family DNA binding protein
MESASDRWLSRQELADRLGVPPKTTAQWASNGTGPPHAKIGRHVRYRLSDIVKWEDAQVLEATRTIADRLKACRADPLEPKARPPQ